MLNCNHHQPPSTPTTRLVSASAIVLHRPVIAKPGRLAAFWNSDLALSCTPTPLPWFYIQSVIAFFAVKGNIKSIYSMEKRNDCRENAQKELFYSHSFSCNSAHFLLHRSRQNSGLPRIVDFCQFTNSWNSGQQNKLCQVWWSAFFPFMPRIPVSFGCFLSEPIRKHWHSQHLVQSCRPAIQSIKNIFWGRAAAYSFRGNFQEWKAVLNLLDHKSWFFSLSLFANIITRRSWSFLLAFSMLLPWLSLFKDGEALPGLTSCAQLSYTWADCIFQKSSSMIFARKLWKVVLIKSPPIDKTKCRLCKWLAGPPFFWGV